MSDTPKLTDAVEGDSCPLPCCASSGGEPRRLNAPHLIPIDRIRDIIYRLRAQADTADEHAATWEQERNWATAERDHQRSLQVGQSLGLTRAANAIGDELAKYAEEVRKAALGETWESSADSIYTFNASESLHNAGSDAPGETEPKLK